MIHINSANKDKQINYLSLSFWNVFLKLSCIRALHFQNCTYKFTFVSNVRLTFVSKFRFKILLKLLVWRYIWFHVTKMLKNHITQKIRLDYQIQQCKHSIQLERANLKP